MVLQEGDPVEPFEATDQDGATVTVDVDDPAVIYFYPKDDTPGCTLEAEQFQRELESYRDADVAVYGVSTDGVESHASFAEDCGLDFPLLADPDGEVAELFDVDVSGGFAPRTTVVVFDGAVHRVYEGVDPDGHARAVLGDLLDDGVAALDG